MSKIKKRRSFLDSILIICMFITLFSVSIPVFAETSGDYTYSINSDNLTCTITEYNGVGGDIVIPSSLDAYTVKAIGNNAFKNITSVTGIDIPNSVNSIGSYGFSGMTNLTNITIPNSVTTIGDYAFMSDKNLNNITIPNSVTSIGNQAFTNCSKLSNVTIPNSVTSIPFYAFSGCSKLSSITIPNSVTSIEVGAFYMCGNLKNVIIPNSVMAIKSEAFGWCGALESITIPNSVTSIEVNTFSMCSTLKNVIIPNSVTSIKSHAFSGCKALESITIPKRVMDIGDLAFFSCKKLTSIYFDGSPSLGTDVFYNCPPALKGYSSDGESLPGITCQTATTHSITVNSFDNGSITPSILVGMKDATISLQMIPAEGYTVNSSLLRYNDGTSDVEINGTSFVMPDKDITISGGFEQIPIPTVTSPTATTDDQTPTWSWTSATGEGYYRYKLNDGSWKYTTSTNFTQATDLKDGTYTLYVQEINDNADWSNSGSTTVAVTTPTYNVAIGSIITGGIIAVSPATAKAGDIIYITITPDSGKQLKVGTLRYNDGSNHDITGTSFVMPAEDVTVEAKFEDIPVVVNPKSSSGSSHHNTKNTIMPSTSVPSQPACPIFSDITNHWAKADIEFVVSQGLMTGTSDERFSPKTPMTRGMFVTALGRLAKIDISSYNNNIFNDIKINSIYSPYVEWANKNNIVSGTGNNQFMPNKAITREEMAAIMINYAKSLDYSVPVTNTAVLYEDTQNIGIWSKAAVVSMQQAGVLNGKSNNYFAPKDTATRAEASVVLHRFVKLVIDQNTAKKQQ